MNLDIESSIGRARVGLRQILNAGDSEFKVGDTSSATSRRRERQLKLEARYLRRRTALSFRGEEDRYVVAQANVPLETNGKIVSEL